MVHDILCLQMSYKLAEDVILQPCQGFTHRSFISSSFVSPFKGDLPWQWQQRLLDMAQPEPHPPDHLLTSFDLGQAKQAQRRDSCTSYLT